MKNIYVSHLRKSFLFLFVLLLATKSWSQYCTTGLYYYSNCFYNNMYIKSVTTTGGMTNITNTNTGCGSSSSYTYYSSQTHSAAPGASVSMTIANNPYYSCEYIIFVDYNGDFDFVDVGEQVHYSVWSWNQTKTITFTIPAATTAGVKRMRIRSRYGYYTYGNFTPCAQEYYGECEDYNLSVCNPLSVTNHPVNKSVCMNGAATYSVQTAGTTTSYQWQVDNGSGFTNISNVGNYSGATTSTLSVNANNNTLNNNKYRVTVGGCGTATSNFATLTVIDSTLIQAQTVSGSFCDGVNTEFNVGMVGTPASSIKWQVDRGTGFVDVPGGFPYSGFNNDTLLITPLGDSMNGYVFRCVTVGTCNRDTTSNITVTVDRIPEFVTDPNDLYVDEGADGSFKISSVGKGNFRWQAKTPKGANYVSITDNANYSGALTNELIVKNPSLAQSGYQYRCLLVGAGNCNSVKDTTAPAMLHVRNTLSVANTEKAAGKVTIFPNPSNGKDEVSIRVATSADLINVTIADKLGRTISKNEVAVSANSGVLNVSKLTPGHYTVTVEDAKNNSTETIKFVKE
ncbi:MAG: T9SS type A sorting domain-containing protein [Sphingobacteriales bacterium]|nr:MAG: T9SS type A sorting domain-containing protein [Sphingobacteriales bacterium]